MPLRSAELAVILHNIGFIFNIPLHLWKILGFVKSSLKGIVSVVSIPLIIFNWIRGSNVLCSEDSLKRAFDFLSFQSSFHLPFR